MSTSAIEELRHASREVVRELGFLEGRFAAVDVTHSQCHALLELDHRGVMTAGELAERLRLEKSTTSRLVEELLGRGWVEAREDAQDRRRRPLTLTDAGRERTQAIHAAARARVAAALDPLPAAEVDAIVRGMQIYARALERARLAEAFVIRPIEPRDNPDVGGVIRRVMPEFGASGPGFSLHDAEVGAMYEAYDDPRAAYFVVERAGRVVGGAGIAPLNGGPPDVCELRKMYFLPEIRGAGMGRRLLARCLEAAAERGFRTCYLESLEGMVVARRLYESMGFRPLCGPLGATGHFRCDAWYAREL